MTKLSLNFDSSNQTTETFNLPGYASLIEVKVRQYYQTSGYWADGSFIAKLYVSTGEERDGIVYFNDIRRSFNRHFNQIIIPWYENVNTIAVTGYKSIAGELTVTLREEESREKVLLFNPTTDETIEILSGTEDLKVEPFHNNLYTVNGSQTKGLYARTNVRQAKTIVLPANSGEYSVNYLGI
ncbi:MAG: hypothetical protein AAGF93_05430 [Cyanobacteria bacterium P01_H01_bin.105]